MEKLTGYCIDSDILIDYLRGTEDARSFLIEASRPRPLYISVVSIVELYAGQETKQEEKQKQIEQFLNNFVVITINISVARKAGGFRRDYGKPFADMIIAASAEEYRLSLVTRNIKHFKELARKEGITLVCPYSS